MARKTSVKKKSAKKPIKKQTKTKEKKPVETAKPGIGPQAQPTIIPQAQPTIIPQTQPAIIPQEPEKPPTPTFSSNKKNPMKINPLFIIIGISVVVAGISVALFMVMSENAEQQLLLIEQERVKIQQQKDLEIKQLELELQEREAAIKEQLLQEEMRQQELAAKKKEEQLQDEMRLQELAAEKQKHELQKTIRLEREETERQEQRQQAEIERQEIIRKQQQEEYEFELEQEEKNQIIILARTNPVLQGLIDGTMYFYIEPIPSYYKVSGINSAIDNIAESLTRNFYGVDIRRTYDVSSADLTISWIKNYGTHVLGESIFKSVIKVGMGSDSCWGTWQAFDTLTIKKIMWHEIGHSLGYSHSNDLNNIMYRSTNQQFDVDVDETFLLESHWSHWFSFCNVGSVQYYAESSEGTDGFNAQIIPPDGSAKEFGDGKGLRYTDCGGEGFQWLKRTCNIASGSYLHFYNPEDHSIYISFKMYDRNSVPWPDMTWDYNAFQYDVNILSTVWDMFH